MAKVSAYPEFRPEIPLSNEIQSILELNSFQGHDASKLEQTLLTACTGQGVFATGVSI
jgi:hypothetical protein